MKLLKVIAHLLDYPTQEVIDNLDELIQVVSADQSLPVAQREAILELIRSWSIQDIYDLQEQYDGLFERGRHVSLLLFEHVHGESRDRGQAMVDLLGVYQSNGFELNSEQMPDYIPLFLEFLSAQEEGFAREWLADVSHILALLEERLQQRGANYQALFNVLLTLSGVQVDRADIKARVAKENPGDTLEDIDREWEDKEVRFDDPIEGGEACSLSNICTTSASSPDEIEIPAASITAAHSAGGRQQPENWHQRFTNKADR
ncbi:MAG: nitrate reductase molybdenum cofactor assembly chaperone [Arenicella sp.]